MICILDYGTGNVGSIANMIKHIGGSSFLTKDINGIKKAKKLILPGVGSFDRGMSKLEESGLIDVIKDQVLNHGIPVLGICLGMQLLTRGSEEGDKKGLGLIAADVIKFKKEISLPIPHMGWNQTKIIKNTGLFQGFADTAKFYYVHSYHVVCDNSDDIVSNCHYGSDFTSSFQHKNIYGTQFHPEKSHKHGMHLLKNFLDL